MKNPGVSQPSPKAAGPRPPRTRSSIRSLSDRLGGFLCAAAAFLTVASFAAVLGNVAFEAWPIVADVGLFPFLFGQTWMPVDFGGGASFGIFNFIAATLATSALALVLALVISLGAALYLACAAPAFLRRLSYSVIDLLAGVPSVVYGFVGLTVVVKLFLDAGIPSGNCVLAASIVLSVMLLPFLVSSIAESMRTVWARYHTAAACLGATTWYTACAIVLPAGLRQAGPSIVAAFARGMGETMAVMMVIGNANLFPELFGKAETIASLIALEMGTAAQGSLHMHGLFAAGLVLLVLVLVVDGLAALLSRHVARRSARSARCSKPSRTPLKLPVRLGPSSRTASVVRFWATASFILVILLIAALFGYVFAQGAANLSWEFLSEAPGGVVLGTEGGIFPAIAGSAWFTGCALALAVPLAAGCAIWRVFYARSRRLADAVGRVLSVSAGIPSIVLGLFSYAVLVRDLGLGRCVLAGGIALGLMILPFMEVRMEKALREVPTSLVRASRSLGCSRASTLRKLVLPLCLGDGLAAVALGGCFALGAAAPLIFTGGVAFAPVPTGLDQPAMALPLHLYLMLAQGTTIPQVYATAFVLMALVLIVNVLVAALSSYWRKKWMSY